jgi:hypothetical protein
LFFKIYRNFYRWRRKWLTIRNIATDLHWVARSTFQTIILWVLKRRLINRLWERWWIDELLFTVMNHELVFWGNGGQRQEQQTGGRRRGGARGESPIPRPFLKASRGAKVPFLILGKCFFFKKKSLHVRHITTNMWNFDLQLINNSWAN